MNEDRHRISVMFSTAALVAAAIMVSWLGACRDEGSKPAQKAKKRGITAVPDPLEQPAEFCFATCARRIYCRLGKPEGKEQTDLFTKEKDRCIQRCIQWMKGHPFDAKAYHACYRARNCSQLTSCLAETKRLLEAAADPDRRRQCLSLCVDFGQCDASERRCMEHCKSPDLAIYRALEHCENRACPTVRDCVIRYVPTLKPPEAGAGTKTAAGQSARSGPPAIR